MSDPNIDPVEPRDEADCPACGLQMIDTGCEWIDAATATQHSDGRRSWLHGPSLDVQETPAGLTCSPQCALDAMYASQTPEGKEALDAVYDALITLNEYYGDVRRTAFEYGAFLPPALGEMAADALNALGSPDWTNRQPRVERCEHALRHVKSEIERLAREIGEVLNGRDE